MSLFRPNGPKPPRADEEQSPPHYSSSQNVDSNPSAIPNDYGDNEDGSDNNNQNNPYAEPSTSDKENEFCGIPKRRACVLITLTCVIVIGISAIVGAVVANHESSVEPLLDSESDAEPPRWYRPAPPGVELTSPQARLDHIRAAVEAVPTLADQSSLLPATANELVSTSSDPLLRAAHWVVHEDTAPGVGLLQSNLIPRLALAAIYHSQGGEAWTNQTNWMSSETNHCDWYGVGCCTDLGYTLFVCRDLLLTDPDGSAGSNTTVVDLNFRANNLSGPVSPYYTLFPHLYSIDFHLNELTGPMPGDLVAEGLLELRYLDLSHNKFSGALPTNFKPEGGKLASLFLHDNPGVTGEFGPIYCTGNNPVFEEVTIDCRRNACHCCVFDRDSFSGHRGLCMDAIGLERVQAEDAGDGN